MKILKLNCKRCGHGWHPRKSKKPKYCPSQKCHSPYWDKEHKKKKKQGDEKIESNRRSKAR